MPRFPRILSCLVAAVLLLPFGRAAQAENRALLIGVSHYSGEVPSLIGPRNDIVLLHEVLARHWGRDADIRVLADSLDQADYDFPLPEAHPATRDAIFDAFAQLAGDIRPGDQVLVYFSGHGSQAPSFDSAEAEPDGLDEIFLAADFELGFDAAKNMATIRNHLRDDEIGAAVDSLVAKGAFVWLVIDACHSGTMERSAGELRARFAALPRGADEVIDLNTTAQARGLTGGLILSQVAAEAPRAPSVVPRALERGGFVGFYAAPPDRLAIEQPMPKEADPADRRQHGVLTWSLIQALEKGGAASYGDLARRIGASVWEVTTAPVPMFVGNLGSVPMVEGEGARSFGLRMEDGQMTLQGGQVEGLAEGTILAVAPGAAPEGEAPLFHVRITHAGMEQSRVEIVEEDPAYPNGLPARMEQEGLRATAKLRALWLEDRLVAMVARPVSRPVSFVLRVALPEGPGAEDVAALLPGSDALAAGVGLQVVAPGAEADVRLAIEGGRLWLLNEQAELITEGPRRAWSIPMAALEAGGLRAALAQLAKSRNLLRVAERFTETPLARGLRARLLTAPGGVAADGSCTDEALGDFTAANGFDLRPVALAPVHHCDRVRLELRNDGEVALDVSPFYFAPQGSVYYLTGYPDGDYFGLRLPAGETRSVEYTEWTAMPDGSFVATGPMRLVVLATPAGSGSDYAADLRDLAGAMPAEVRQGGDGLGALLSDAAFPQGVTRSSSNAAEEDRAAALLVPLETFAPGEDAAHP